MIPENDKLSSPSPTRNSVAEQWNRPMW